jgi:Tfp pilus assembly protein PilF
VTTRPAQPARCRHHFLTCGLLLLSVLIPTRAVADEAWTLVQSPYFTVLTTAQPEKARLWAMELERFRLVLGQVVTVPESNLRPVTVVIFPNDRAMRPYKPLEKGKPQQIAGLFVKFGDSNAIMLALDANPEQVRRTIFHEVVHWYSHAGEGTLPMWLEEGVAEVYSTFTADAAGNCVFGGPIKEHMLALNRDRGWSFEKIATTPRGALEYNKGNRADIFYAGSWVAAHYLLFGKDSPGRPAILSYLEARAREGDTPAVFARAFGTDYAGFRAHLIGYQDGGKYVKQRITLPAGEIDKNLITRRATPAEVDLGLGMLLIGSSSEHRPAGIRRVERAAAAAPENPMAWQVLGEAALLDNNEAAAEANFEKAVAAGSESADVHHNHGVFLSRRASLPDGTIDSDAAKQSIQAFRRALILNPRLVPAYEGIAAIIFATENYDPRDRELLEAGARIAPDNLDIDLGLAACDLRAGRRERGRERLKWVAQSPQVTARTRDHAESILHADEWNEVSEKISVLFSAGHYSQAVALIDEARVRFPERRYAESLAANRRDASALHLINQAVDLANSGDRRAASGRLQQVLASDAPPRLKNQAQSLLDQIAAP